MADIEPAALPVSARQVLPEVDPRGQGKALASGYFEWLKWVVRTGNREITRASIGGTVALTYGFYGHNSFARRTTMQASSGLSESDLKRSQKVLVSAGWLRAYPRRGTSTIFCPALLVGAALREPGYGGPCSLCWPSLSRQVTTDLTHPREVTDDLGDRSSVTPNQGSLTREPAADGTLTESVTSPDALNLTAILYDRRPELGDPELLEFAAVLDRHIGTKGLDELRAAVEAFTAKAKVIKPRTLDAFINAQRPAKRPQQPAEPRRRTKAEEKEARFYAEAEAAEQRQLEMEQWRQRIGDPDAELPEIPF